MAVNRTEKKNNFTIMSNEHLRDSRLSLKAKGLMSVILSLPEDWEYSVRGFAAIGRDGEEAVRAVLRELEKYGYLKRRRRRDKTGVLKECIYDVFESPIGEKPKQEKPEQEKPEQEKPEQEKPIQENRPQLSTKVSSTNKSNTYSLIESENANYKKWPAAERHMIHGKARTKRDYDELPGNLLDD